MAIANGVNATASGFQSITSGGVWNGRTITSLTGIAITNADGTGGNPTLSALTNNNGQVANLGIAYSAGTFTVQGAAASLSAANPGYITLPSRANPGQQKTFTITANQTFTDSAGANSLGNNLFGLTTNIAYAQDLPFYIYFGADNTDANGTFFISRVPHCTVCPVAGKIAQSGNTNASTQGGFFAMQAITAANFAGQPCVCIGAFRMRYTSAASPWTVQALTDGSTASGSITQADGIGCFHEGTKFLVATGQFGAASGSFFQNNGGTAPAWSAQSMNYTLHRNGVARFELSCATSTAGLGAGFATMALPITSIDSNGAPGNFVISTGFGTFDFNASTNSVVLIGATAATSFVTFTNLQLAVGSFVGTFSVYAEST